MINFIKIIFKDDFFPGIASGRLLFKWN